VSLPSREELESLRADGLSAERRRALRAAARASADPDVPRGARGVEAILDWIDELRALFGDPAVDRRPWRGSDFRL
jgi:hypothetical protein